MESNAKKYAKVAGRSALAIVAGALTVFVVVIVVDEETTLHVPELNDSDLASLFKQLVELDSSLNNLLEWNLQHNLAINKSDSPLHLFSYVDSDIKNFDSVRAMLELASSFNPDVSVKETPKDWLIDNFLDAVMETKVMKQVFVFLVKHKLIEDSESEFRSKVREMWFGLYNRDPSGPKGSSGFEHVFVGELGKKNVIGFHNWIQFASQEQSLVKEANLDYWGYKKYSEFEYARFLECKFKWLKKTKPTSSFWVGTTPEFELAVYTACFHVKASLNCSIEINGQRFDIKADWRNGTDRLVDYAYPIITI